MMWIGQRRGRPARVHGVVLALGLLLTAAGCSHDNADRATSASSSTSPDPAGASAATAEVSMPDRDFTATTGPECTVGTIPEGRAVPSDCDRLYSPFLAPGAACIEGQSADCIDPDDDGAFTYIVGGGRCLVERKDPVRCRDDDGDGRLDEPLPD